MTYKKYGTTFRQLREQLHLSLSSFASVGISKAALSKFERGESMMSFEKVVMALQVMGVSLEEFEFFLNDYSLNEPEQLLNEIENATIIGDTIKLSALCKTAELEGFSYIAIAAKSSIAPLESLDIEKITDYLYEIDVWSYKELCIFYFTMSNLDTRDILYVLDLFLANGHKLFNAGKYRSYLVQACCRAVTILSYRGYREYASHILNRIKSFNLINTMFLRNLRNISYGYWLYRFKDTTMGDEIMLNALKIFNEVSTPDIAKYYENRYNYFVKGDKSISVV